MSWVRSLLILATTLASSRFHHEYESGALKAEEGECLSAGVFSACSTLDKRVTPFHILCPLLVPTALISFAHAPTLLLASRSRVWGLWAATWRILLVYTAILASAAAYLWASKAWGYALSLHLSVLYVCQERCRALLIGDAAYKAAQLVSLASLVLGAWQLGPPLPAWDAPGIPGCCGAVAHMAAWAASETLGRAGVVALEWARAGGIQ